MKTLQEVIENKASFRLIPPYDIVSKQVFKPEDYSLDFFLKKFKANCYFLFSCLTSNINLPL